MIFENNLDPDEAPPSEDSLPLNYPCYSFFVCRHWEAFVMSVVFQYEAHWANYCSLDQLAANLKAGAQSAGHGSPELCVLCE